MFASLCGLRPGLSASCPMEPRHPWNGSHGPCAAAPGDRCPFCLGGFDYCRGSPGGVRQHLSCRSSFLFILCNITVYGYMFIRQPLLVFLPPQKMLYKFLYACVCILEFVAVLFFFL